MLDPHLDHRSKTRQRELMLLWKSWSRIDDHCFQTQSPEVKRSGRVGGRKGQGGQRSGRVGGKWGQHKGHDKGHLAVQFKIKGYRAERIYVIYGYLS